MRTQHTLALFAAGLVTTVLATACTRDDDTAATADTYPAATEPVTTPDTSAPATAQSPTTTADASANTPADPATTPVPPAATTGSATMAFDELDKNNDGAISPDELSETDSLRQNFPAADTDANGSLSQIELEAHRATTRTPGG